jgi:DNA-binding LytR/AlgR family response regulator
MKGLEDLLPSSQFIRIQKSYIVSKSAITAVRKNSIFIGVNELPVGENYKDAVMALIGKQPEI